ncbi:MAG: CopG family transcriptional regulator [Candidatus Hadarchaeum sp.]
MSTVESSPSDRRVLRPRRRGRPITVYLDDTLSQRLSEAARLRHIDKSELVRIALDRLLTQLETGQLQLPLGI